MRYSRSKPSRGVLYVGDSLGVGTAPSVKGANADVKVGRPSSEGLNIVKRKGQGYDRIVFDLGTNDASVGALKSSVRGLRRVAHGKSITMATIHGPDAARKNAYLRKLARQGKINLVDTTEIELSPDGIHATGKGYKERAKLVNQALRSSGKTNTQGLADSPSAPSTSNTQLEALQQYVLSKHFDRRYQRGR